MTPENDKTKEVSMLDSSVLSLQEAMQFYVICIVFPHHSFFLAATCHFKFIPAFSYVGRALCRYSVYNY